MKVHRCCLDRCLFFAALLFEHEDFRLKLADILPERLQPFLDVKAFQNERPLDLAKIRVVRRIVLLRIVRKHESVGWVAGRTGAVLLILYLDVHFFLHLQFVFESGHVLLQPLDGLPEYLDVLVLLFDYF